MDEKKTYIAPPPMIMPGSDKPVEEGSGFGGPAASPYSPAGYNAPAEEKAEEADGEQEEK